MKKKKTVKTPKPRHTWTINPKTRIKKSAKKYSRSKAKRIEKKWVDEF